MINNYELQVRCIGLESNDIFPLENTGRGKDISPAFEFENLSPMAKTIAITLEDIKHPLFKNFTHWLYGIFQHRKILLEQFLMEKMLALLITLFKELPMAGTSMLALNRQKESNINIVLQFMY